MAISKVVYAGETLVDLTADTVTADVLKEGYTAHDKAGNPVVGTFSGGGGGDPDIEQLMITYLKENGTSASVNPLMVSRIIANGNMSPHLGLYGFYIEYLDDTENILMLWGDYDRFIKGEINDNFFNSINIGAGVLGYSGGFSMSIGNTNTPQFNLYVSPCYSIDMM